MGTKYIAFACANHLQTKAFAVLAAAFTYNEPLVTFLVKWLALTVSDFGTLCLIFIPKIWMKHSDGSAAVMAEAKDQLRDAAVHAWNKKERKEERQQERTLRSKELRRTGGRSTHGRSTNGKSIDAQSTNDQSASGESTNGQTVDAKSLNPGPVSKGTATEIATQTGMSLRSTSTLGSRQVVITIDSTLPDAGIAVESDTTLSDVEGDATDANCTDVEMESSEVNSSDAESDSVIIGFTGDAVTRELRVPTSEEPKAPPAPPVPPPLSSVVAPAVGGAGPEDVLHPRSPTPQDGRSNLSRAHGFWGRG